ncbi:helix-turn-helix domain-containing protein [Burkholderia ubonensis]|uniref:AlbA family DNA-binding domain-containing protein n=1 Tax=Burkholderia ubonensis TaxID=101571 RepID=UPI000757E000|nr:ATP-binding protein [Burkholderia ubonensis]KVZ44404.1 hypothetical protein WL17_04935 [Burkholderia ubonensis]
MTLPARLTDIDAAAIARLIAHGARESRTLDFKRELDLSDKGKHELAKDVCAFANAMGGNIIIGVREDAGVAQEIVPIAVADLDHTLQQLTNTLRDRLEPSVTTLETQPVQVDGGHVVVLRVTASPSAPHRVQRDGQFYLRNSVGKEAMDMHALRTAFAVSAGLAARARTFRDARLEALRRNEPPVLLVAGPRAVLHVIPVHALTRADAHPAAQLRVAATHLCAARPTGVLLETPWVNLDGVVCPSHRALTRDHLAYGQIFRDGCVEIVGTYMTFDLPGGPTGIIYPPLYEHPMMRHAAPAVGATLEALDVPAPAYLGLSLLGVAGHPVQVLQSSRYEVQRALPEYVREIVAPPVYLERWDDDWLAALRPAFDMVWNAVGIESTQTDFDAADPALRWL